MPIRYFRRPRLLAGLLVMSISTSSFASSPALSQFMQEVWQNNPSIQAAEAALLAAKSRKQAASKAIYNPELDFDLERTAVNTFSLGINQTLDRGNKRAAATSKADAEIQASEAELKARRLQVSAEVLNALVGLQYVDKLQQLAKQRVLLMQNLVNNTESRQSAGDVGLQNLALARVALSEAKMQLANTAAQKAKNLGQLQIATGFFVKHWPALASEPPAPAPSLSNLEKYLNQLPELNRLKAMLLASKSNLRLSQANRKSDPSFGVRGGMDGEDALLGVSVSMPLFVRNNFRAEVEVANQERFQIENTLMSAIRSAEATLNASHRQYQIVFDAWQSWKQNGINNLDEQMKLIQAIWKSGEMNTTNYLIQAKQNVDAQETAVELSTQMWNAWIDWLVASGELEQWINASRNKSN